MVSKALAIPRDVPMCCSYRAGWCCWAGQRWHTALCCPQPLHFPLASSSPHNSWADLCFAQPHRENKNATSKKQPWGYLFYFFPFYSKNEWIEVTHTTCPLCLQPHSPCRTSSWAPQNWCSIGPIFLSDTIKSLSICFLARTDTVSLISLLLLEGFLICGCSKLPLWHPQGQVLPTQAGLHTTPARWGIWGCRNPDATLQTAWGLQPAPLHAGGRTGSQRCASESPRPLGFSGPGTV